MLNRKWWINKQKSLTVLSIVRKCDLAVATTVHVWWGPMTSNQVVYVQSNSNFANENKKTKNKSTVELISNRTKEKIMFANWSFNSKSIDFTIQTDWFIYQHYLLWYVLTIGLGFFLSSSFRLWSKKIWIFFRSFCLWLNAYSWFLTHH